MSHNEYSYRGSRGSYYDRKETSHRGGYRGRGHRGGKSGDHYSSSYRGRGGFSRDRSHGKRDRDSYESAPRGDPYDSRYRGFEEGKRYEDRKGYDDRKDDEREPSRSEHDKHEPTYSSRREEDDSARQSEIPNEHKERDRNGEKAETDHKSRDRPESARKVSSPAGPEKAKNFVYTNPWVGILKLGEGRTAGRVESTHKEVCRVNEDITRLQEEKMRLGNNIALLEIYGARDALNAEICTEKLNEFSYL